MEESTATTGGTPPTRVAAGIWRIVLPTPYPVGPVNVYLLDDDPLTLFDTGQADPGARAALDAGLAHLGRRVEDLERIVISHQHIDHWGMGAELAQRSGAEVCALDPFADWLERFPDSLEGEERFAQGVMRTHGLPGTVSGPGYRADVAHGGRAVIDMRLHDGDLLRFAGRELRVLRRPGHSPSDTVFHDEDSGVMIGADHIMERPSTPVLSPPLDGSPAITRPYALGDSLRSLDATEALRPGLVLPGHGDVITDVLGAIAGHRARWDRMTEDTRAALTDAPRPAIEVARDVRGSIVDRAPFFALCDVLGCLDRLVEAGDAVEDPGGAGFARR